MENKLKLKGIKKASRRAEHDEKKNRKMSTLLANVQVIGYKLLQGFFFTRKNVKTKILVADKHLKKTEEQKLIYVFFG